MIISDRHAHSIALSLTDDGDASSAAAQLLDLSSRGIKLRTRALTTTLFARIMMSDLFLHGIGGAKYDQVTDQIVRLFFDFDPPEFATVSATLRLPIGCEATEPFEVGRWDQRLRELRFHPEQFIACHRDAGDGHSAAACDIVAAKRRWLETPKTRENARARHVGIVAANQALQPFTTPLRLQIERERDQYQLRKRSETILRSREYSFCLYPREHFDKLLSEPRLW